MQSTDDATIAALREQVSETRRRRMAAQKIIAASSVLDIAMERAARDRSSGATDETDSLREEISELRDQIIHEVRQIDRIHVLFNRADSVYASLPQRPRLVSELNHEAKWRARLHSDHQWRLLRIELPPVEEII